MPTTKELEESKDPLELQAIENQEMDFWSSLSAPFRNSPSFQRRSAAIDNLYAVDPNDPFSEAEKAGPLTFLGRIGIDMQLVGDLASVEPIFFGYTGLEIVGAFAEQASESLEMGAQATAYQQQWGMVPGGNAALVATGMLNAVGVDYDYANAPYFPPAPEEGRGGNKNVFFPTLQSYADARNPATYGITDTELLQEATLAPLAAYGLHGNIFQNSNALNPATNYATYMQFIVDRDQTLADTRMTVAGLHALGNLTDPRGNPGPATRYQAEALKHIGYEYGDDVSLTSEQLHQRAVILESAAMQASQYTGIEYLETNLSIINQMAVNFLLDPFELASSGFHALGLQRKARLARRAENLHDVPNWQAAGEVYAAQQAAATHAGNFENLRKPGVLSELNPFALPASGQAAKATDPWDLIGSVFSRYGTDRESMSYLVDQVVESPARAINVGIDVSQYPSLRSQADANGILHLDGGLWGNADVVRNWDIFEYVKSQLPSMDSINTGLSNTEKIKDFDPVAFQKEWTGIFREGANTIFGVDAPSAISSFLSNNIINPVQSFIGNSFVGNLWENRGRTNFDYVAAQTWELGDDAIGYNPLTQSAPIPPRYSSIDSGGEIFSTAEDLQRAIEAARYQQDIIDNADSFYHASYNRSGLLDAGRFSEFGTGTGLLAGQDPSLVYGTSHLSIAEEYLEMARSSGRAPDPGIVRVKVRSGASRLLDQGAAVAFLPRDVLSIEDIRPSSVLDTSATMEDVYGVDYLDDFEEVFDPADIDITDIETLNSSRLTWGMEGDPAANIGSANRFSAEELVRHNSELERASGLYTTEEAELATYSLASLVRDWISESDYVSVARGRLGGLSSNPLSTLSQVVNEFAGPSFQSNYPGVAARIGDIPAESVQGLLAGVGKVWDSPSIMDVGGDFDVDLFRADWDAINWDIGTRQFPEPLFAPDFHESLPGIDEARVRRGWLWNNSDWNPSRSAASSRTPPLLRGINPSVEYLGEFGQAPSPAVIPPVNNGDYSLIPGVFPTPDVGSSSRYGVIGRLLEPQITPALQSVGSSIASQVSGGLSHLAQNAVDIGVGVTQIDYAEGLRSFNAYQRGAAVELFINSSTGAWIGNAVMSNVSSAVDGVWNLRPTMEIQHDLRYRGGLTSRILDAVPPNASMPSHQPFSSIALDVDLSGPSIFDGSAYLLGLTDKRNPLAMLSTYASTLWTGDRSILGGRVGFGEANLSNRVFESSQSGYLGSVGASKMAEHYESFVDAGLHPDQASYVVNQFAQNLLTDPLQRGEQLSGFGREISQLENQIDSLSNSVYHGVGPTYNQAASQIADLHDAFRPKKERMEQIWVDGLSRGMSPADIQSSYEYGNLLREEQAMLHQVSLLETPEFLEIQRKIYGDAATGEVGLGGQLSRLKNQYEGYAKAATLNSGRAGFAQLASGVLDDVAAAGSPERAAIQDVFAREVLPSYDEAMGGASYAGTDQVRFTMLDATFQNNLTSWASAWSAFPNFALGSMRSVAERVITNPRLANVYSIVQQGINRENERSGVTRRDEGTFPINLFGQEFRVRNPFDRLIMPIGVFQGNEYYDVLMSEASEEGDIGKYYGALLGRLGFQGMWAQNAVSGVDRDLTLDKISPAAAAIAYLARSGTSYLQSGLEYSPPTEEEMMLDNSVTSWLGSSTAEYNLGRTVLQDVNEGDFTPEEGRWLFDYIFRRQNGLGAMEGEPENIHQMYSTAMSQYSIEAGVSQASSSFFGMRMRPVSEGEQGLHSARIQRGNILDLLNAAESGQSLSTSNDVWNAYAGLVQENPGLIPGMNDGLAMLLPPNMRDEDEEEYSRPGEIPLKIGGDLIAAPEHMEGEYVYPRVGKRPMIPDQSVEDAYNINPDAIVSLGGPFSMLGRSPFYDLRHGNIIAPGSPQSAPYSLAPQEGTPAGDGAPRGDDFTKIKGVGPASRKKLYDAGYTTWEQLERATLGEIEEILGEGTDEAVAAYSGSRDATQHEFFSLLDSMQEQILSTLPYSSPAADPVTGAPTASVVDEPLTWQEELELLPKIGPVTAANLIEGGYGSWEELASASPADIDKNIEGFGEVLSDYIVSAAQSALNNDGVAPSVVSDDADAFGDTRSLWLYALTDPRNDVTRYVGQTKRTPLERFTEHLNDDVPDYGINHPKTSWIRNLLGDGLAPEQHVIGELGSDEYSRRGHANWYNEQGLDDWEQIWIGFMRYGGVLPSSMEIGNVSDIVSYDDYQGLLEQYGVMDSDLRDLWKDFPNQSQRGLIDENGNIVAPINNPLTAADVMSGMPIFSGIEGLTTARQQALYDAGFESWDEIVAGGRTAAMKRLEALPGIGPATAEDVYEYAMAQLGGDSTSISPSATVVGGSSWADRHGFGVDPAEDPFGYTTYIPTQGLYQSPTAMARAHGGFLANRGVVSSSDVPWYVRPGRTQGYLAQSGASVVGGGFLAQNGVPTLNSGAEWNVRPSTTKGFIAEHGTPVNSSDGYDYPAIIDDGTMTMGEAIDIAGRYGHVPLRISGPGIDGTGGGPDNPYDNVVGVWGVPDGKGGVIPLSELGAPPGYTQEPQKRASSRSASQSDGRVVYDGVEYGGEPYSAGSIAVASVVAGTEHDMSRGGGQQTSSHLPFAGDHPLTQSYGVNPERYQSWGGHMGLDYSMPVGTDLLSLQSGTVVDTGYSPTGGTPSRAGTGGFGNWVILDYGNGYTAEYAHLSEIGVKPGEKISAGQVIGQSGHTGTSDFPHLHFGVRKDGEYIDPNDFYKTLEEQVDTASGSNDGYYDWEQIKGIGETREQTLYAAGITSPQILLTKTREEVDALKGFGPELVEDLFAEASRYVGGSGSPAASQSKTEATNSGGYYDWEQVKGIGPAKEQALYDAGVTSPQILASMSFEELDAIEGFGVELIEDLFAAVGLPAPDVPEEVRVGRTSNRGLSGAAARLSGASEEDLEIDPKNKNVGPEGYVNWEQYSGIGPTKEKALYEAGIIDYPSLFNADVGDLEDIPRFGPSTVEDLLEAAREDYTPPTGGQKNKGRYSLRTGEPMPLVSPAWQPPAWQPPDSALWVPEGTYDPENPAGGNLRPYRFHEDGSVSGPSIRRYASGDAGIERYRQDKAFLDHMWDQPGPVNDEWQAAGIWDMNAPTLADGNLGTYVQYEDGSVWGPTIERWVEGDARSPFLPGVMGPRDEEQRGTRWWRPGPKVPGGEEILQMSVLGGDVMQTIGNRFSASAGAIYPASIPPLPPMVISPGTPVGDLKQRTAARYGFSDLARRQLYGTKMDVRYVNGASAIANLPGEGAWAGAYWGGGEPNQYGSTGNTFVWSRLGNQDDWTQQVVTHEFAHQWQDSRMPNKVRRDWEDGDWLSSIQDDDERARAMHNMENNVSEEDGASHRDNPSEAYAYAAQLNDVDEPLSPTIKDYYYAGLFNDSGDVWESDASLSARIHEQKPATPPISDHLRGLPPWAPDENGAYGVTVRDSDFRFKGSGGKKKGAAGLSEREVEEMVDSSQDDILEDLVKLFSSRSEE